jgi:hypothetical protein
MLQFRLTSGVKSARQYAGIAGRERRFAMERNLGMDLVRATELRHYVRGAGWVGAIRMAPIRLQLMRCGWR